MHDRSPKLLEDIRDAAAFIVEVTQERASSQYSIERLLRPAVELDFEIIGEAVLMNHALAWGTVQIQLPALLRDVQALLPQRP